MDLVNVVINIDPRRLDLPLCPWKMRSDAGFVAVLLGVPADVSAVRAKSVLGAVVNAAEHANGAWTLRLSVADAAAFLEGDDYEIWGTAPGDTAVYLGSGRIDDISARG